MNSPIENKASDKIGTTRDGITQIGKDLRADAHSAIDKAAEQAQPAADRLASSAHAGVDKVADGVNKATDKVADGAKQVVDKASSVSKSLTERGQKLGVAYQQFAESGRGYVRTSPAISVLIAAAAGYGLSKLLSSRK